MAAVPIFEITDGVTTISLTNRTGFMIRDWSPSRPQYKGGGVRINSPMATGSALTMTKYTNIIDTFDIINKHKSQDLMIREAQNVDRLLIKAVNYWTTDWQTDPVYLIARGPRETNTRYATIKSYAIPGTTNPYAQPFFNCMADPGDVMVLTIEHGIWQADIPGTATCVETSAQQDYYDVDDGIFYPTQSADDCFISIGAAAITLNSAGIQFGQDGATETHDNGVRFRNVTIPVGATIVSAFVRYTSNNAENGTTCNADLYGESSIVPALFTTFVDFQGRVRTAAKVDWDNIGAWVAGTQYDTPDIASLVQEIIDIGGWASGNNMCIFTENDSSDVGARRIPAAWDNVTYDPPELHVKWRAPDDITFGRSATCTDEVYVANKHNVAQLTHVYSYQAIGANWGANAIGSGGAYDLWPNPVADGDICYFGIDTTIPDSGPFCSLVFDISQACVYSGNADADWEYWNGAWVALTVEDNTTDNAHYWLATYPFEKTGVGSVHWEQPSDWATTTVNGVTGYWVRIKASIPVPPGDAIAPQPIHDGAARDIYTIVTPRVEIDDAQVAGDIPALLQVKICAQSESRGLSAPHIDGFVSRIMMGLRSKHRSPNGYFTPYLNCSDNEQHPAGALYDWTILGGTSSVIADPNAPTGRVTQYSPLGIEAMAPEGYALISGAAIAEYVGEYHCFMRYKVSAGANGDMRARLRISMGLYAAETVTTETKDLVVESNYTAIDFGRIIIPPGGIPSTESFYELAIFVDMENTVAAARTALIYDIILLPVDEWFGDIQQPVIAGAGLAAPLSEYWVLAINSLCPRKEISAYVRWQPWTAHPDAIVTYYIPYAAARAILQANADQRMWYFVMQNPNRGRDLPPYHCPPYLSLSIQAHATARYLNMRGAR